ncbi:MAG TPA: phenylalanine--tRNA ligase beta subunit-related protein [Thermoanaerobaculia bacterium]|nr:phenylalanine--tRNA ligase beta subunit-related protein [Thermoanaerobaculia bacterium]
MKLQVAPDFLALFPEALIGVVWVRGCDNAASSAEIAARLRLAEAGARTAFAGAVLAEEPRIACWREAYRKFGANPKKSPSSIENLLRRVAKGETVRPINPLVDIYNAVSLERLLPAGGEDLAAVRGDVVLCLAGAAEPPVQLLGEGEARPPHPGEVIYRDDVSAICRRWNWKEADRTKLTAATRDAVLVVEALPPTGRGELERALADLAELVARYCGGEAGTAILDAASREVELGSAVPLKRDS